MSTVITLKNFYVDNGNSISRDVKYASQLTDEVKTNAGILLPRVNSIIAMAEARGIVFHINPLTECNVDSGWRPAEINAKTKGAAPRSKHMIGAAIDIYDPEGAFDEWLLANQTIMEQVKLWMEHPASTKGWSHLQCLPPASGNRVFYP